jgi:putative peptidoglycan lipid II flippase
MSRPAVSRRLVRANLVVAAGTGLSRITGFGRVAALAYALGQTSLTDTYNLSNTMPNVVYELVLGGVLTATLVPVFVSHIDNDDDRATDAVVSVVVAVMLGLTVVAVLAAPLIVHLYTLRAPAAEVDAIREEATTLARFFLPQIPFYGLTALGVALLNARRRFAAPAFAPVLNNLIVIAALLLLPHVVDGDLDLDAAIGNTTVTLLLGLGTTLGIVAMTAAVWIAVRHAGIHIRARMEWRHPAVREVARLSGWTVGYVIANQVALLVVSILALREEGHLSAYQAAFIFFQLPHGLLAVSLMTTFAPDLAERAGRGDIDGYRDRMSLGLRLLALVMAPAAIGYAVLAVPLVSALIERGALSADDAVLTANTLGWFAAGLFGFSVYLFVLRGFYAMKDTRRPFWINVAENALNIVLALAFVGRWGAPGLAAAYAIAYSVAAVAALLLLARQVGGFAVRPLAVGMARPVVIALGMGALVWGLASLVGSDHGGGALARVVVGVLVGVVAYVGAMLALHVPEAVALRSLWRDR